MIFQLKNQAVSNLLSLIKLFFQPPIEK